MAHGAALARFAREPLARGAVAAPWISIPPWENLMCRWPNRASNTNVGIPAWKQEGVWAKISPLSGPESGKGPEFALNVTRRNRW